MTVVLAIRGAVHGKHIPESVDLFPIFPSRITTPKTTLQIEQGDEFSSSLSEGIANGGWIPWYGYRPVEFPWLQQGMRQPKRKPVMPKPPPPPRPELARGDVIKDQSLGLAWHNFLDRYTPSWTPAPPPPPPKPAMPPKQDDIVNGLWMPSWKFYNEIDPGTFPWFVKGYRTTAPGPMAPDGYSFFNYIL
ncbi:hypothetical protein TELCIR_02781 [Teladorsagia circumcincta]|uniref:Uncharacterized protein n=1 Tax=Teladorsagia circumcincta TaxID=45464 RepID=A0A2G9UY54_TELCI|nr:hypothetical protein TELCIR_02781 [Teladorsagia circumcincta]